VEDADVYRHSRPVVLNAIEALGYRDGIFHMELFADRSTGTGCFGECASRRGGGLKQEQILYNCGMVMARASILCAVGRHPSPMPNVRPGGVAHTHLPARAGTPLSCPSASDLLDLPGVVYARLDLAFGAKMDEPTDTVAKVGQVPFHDIDNDAAQRRIDEVIAWFIERTVVAGRDSLPVTCAKRPRSGAWTSRRPRSRRRANRSC
jgi:hypothetical protein